MFHLGTVCSCFNLCFFMTLIPLKKLMWQNTATVLNVVYRESQVFAYPEEMAQSKTIAGVPDSQSPHPDSCSLSPLHPFFSTKIGFFYFLCFYSTSFYFCIFALSSSAFTKVREMFFKLFLCSLPLIHEEMFQFLLH